MANEVYLNADGSLDSAITDLFAAADYVTISSGAITVTKSAVQADTQSSAATDDLDTITMASVEDGKVLFIRSAAAGRTVVLKHLTGNIYNSGGDVRLTTPEQLAMLVYSGSKWVVVGCGCGGTGDTVPPIDDGDIDEGSTVPCVAAARMVEYLTYIIDAAKAEIANTRLDIVAAFGAAIAVVQPAYSSPAVMALAALFDTSFADATAVDAAFDGTFYTTVQNILYCADADNDGVISAAELVTVTSELAALATDEADIIGSLIAIMGAAGLSNAIGLSTTTAGDCTGDCEWCYMLDFTAADGTTEGFTIEGGTYASGDGWQGVYGNANNQRNVWGYWEFPSAALATRIEMVYSKGSGSGASNVNRLNALNPATSYAFTIVSQNTDNTFGTSLTKGINLLASLEGIGFDINTGATVATCTVHSLTIYGKGSNPFGSTNC